MNTRKGRLVAWGSVGVGVAVFVIFVVAFWGQSVDSKLVRDPDFLGEIVEKPEDTPEGKAVRRFVRTRAGARKLVELHVEDMLDEFSS